MNLFLLLLLLCGICLSAARVVLPDSADLVIAPTLSSNTSNSTKTLASNIKTIIPDLEALPNGYVWRPGNKATQDYLWWTNKNIDVLTWTPTDPNIAVVDWAANKAWDKSPNRVKLNDVLLSWWVYKIGQGRQAADITTIMWKDVTQDDTRRAVNRVYKILGNRNQRDDEKNQAYFRLAVDAPAAKEAEAFAYFASHSPIVGGCVQMFEEYAEFAGRHVAAVGIQYTGGVGGLAHFNVYVEMPR